MYEDVKNRRQNQKKVDNLTHQMQYELSKLWFTFWWMNKHAINNLHLQTLRKSIMI